MEARTGLMAGLVLVMLVAPLVAGVAAAEHGVLPAPLPQGTAAVQAMPALGDQATLTGRTLEQGLAYSGGQLLRAADDIRAGLDQQKVVVPESYVRNIVDRAGDDGAASVRNVAGMAALALAVRDASVTEASLFASLAERAVENKVGVHVDVPPGQEGVLPTGPAPCVAHPQAALDAAPEGADIVVCAGTYQGPIVVRQHFVTLRSEQGPLATVIEAAGGRGVVVEATGVTLKGFTVQGAQGPGGVGVLVGGGEAFATVLQDNLVRRNTVGVEVRNGGSTLLLHNTIRDHARVGGAGGVGVLVTAPLAADSSGVVLAANNFLNNGRYAVQATSGAPAVAVLNYYGQGTGPNLDVAGQCVGASALAGSPLCRNGVGPGVLLAGFSPVPL